MPKTPEPSPMSREEEFLKKYPLTPDLEELASTLGNGGKPVARPATQGAAEMTAILIQLRKDQAATVAAMATATGWNYKNLLADLDALKAEIRDYEARLKEYQTQQDSLN